MQVVSLVCESFNVYDVGTLIEPFKSWHYSTDFSMRPADDSVSAMFCMQCGYVGRRLDKRRKLAGLFDKDRAYLGDYVKQRIISSAWPMYCDVSRFDPDANVLANRWTTNGNIVLAEYLDSGAWQSGRHDHLIHWGRIGHVGVRHSDESRGIPTSLAKTWIECQEWLVENILPKIDVDNTLVLVHPDHGSARANIDLSLAMSQGFMISNRGIPSVYDWRDYKRLVYHTVHDIS